jgi:isoleucyl-tRNA synthetase
LQAAPRVVMAPDYAIDLDGLDLAEIAITSKIGIERGEIPAEAFTLADVPGVGVVFLTAEGEKCQRCWKVLPDVGTHGHEGLCGRCADAVETGGGAR